MCFPASVFHFLRFLSNQDGSKQSGNRDKNKLVPGFNAVAVRRNHYYVRPGFKRIPHETDDRRGPVRWESVDRAAWEKQVSRLGDDCSDVMNALVF